MFEALRKMIFPIIIITLLFFVAMIVLEWGLNFSRRQQFGNPNAVAVINGEEVPWESYYRIYNNLYQTEVQQLDGDVPESRVKELEQIAWNQLLHDRLLMQEVDKNNVSVTDEELYAYLKLSPPAYVQSLSSFQTNGQFDYQKYLNAMVQPEAAAFWSQVEPMARRDVMKLKVQEMVIQAAMVTEDEVRESFMADHETVKVGLVNVTYNSQAAPAPETTDEQVLQYFNEHISDYELAERAVLRVVMIDKSATENDWEIIGARAREIYDSLKAGADFADMAQRYSEDNSAQSGGDLGWFPEGQMVKEFNDRAFSMKDGDISEPFRTQFGWHIMKHHGYRTDNEVPRGKTKKENVKKAHASHILLRIKASPESLDKAYNDIGQFHQIAAAEGFEAASGQTGLEIKTTRAFTKGMQADILGPDKAANDFAFNNKVGTISDVMDNNKYYYVAEIAEKLPAGPPAFEDVKTRVRADCNRELVLKRCEEKAASVHEAVVAGAKMDKAAADVGLKYEEVGPFSRNGFIPGIGREATVIGTAFGLKEVGQVSGPVGYTGGAAVLKLIEHSSPDLTEFNESRDSIYTAIKQSKQQELYSRWFQKLIDESKIINNLERANQQEQASL